MKRKKLREIVCALQAMSGDIAGGVFSWTSTMQGLFAIIMAGRTLDDADRHALSRGCELAASVAHALHDWGTETRFESYRKAILHDMADDARDFLGYILEDTLSRRCSNRAESERYYCRISWAPKDGDEEETA